MRENEKPVEKNPHSLPPLTSPTKASIYALDGTTSEDPTAG